MTKKKIIECDVLESTPNLFTLFFPSAFQIHYLNHFNTPHSSFLHPCPSLSPLSLRLPSSNSKCLSEGISCPFPLPFSLFPFPAPAQHHNSADLRGSLEVSYPCKRASLVMHGWAPIPISITKLAGVNCAAGWGRSVWPVKYTSPEMTDRDSRQLICSVPSQGSCMQLLWKWIVCRSFIMFQIKLLKPKLQAHRCHPYAHQYVHCCMT